MNVHHYNELAAVLTIHLPYLQITFLLGKLTLSTPRGTDGSFQPVTSMSIVLFVVTALPSQVGL